MSILKLERKLERLNAQIQATEAQLGGLKQQRKELKFQLEEAKRAAKNGFPCAPEPRDLVHAMGSRFSAVVVLPLARLIGIR